MSRLPKGWTLERLRYSSRLNPSKTEVRGRSPGEEVSFVPMEAVGELGGLRLDQTRAIGAVESGYSYFRNGDIVVAKITPCFENGKGALAAGLQGGVAFGTTELHVLRPYRRLDARFLFYITLSHPFRALGEAEMYGAGGQKRVPEDFFRDFRTAIPSADIQRAIADFLDRKTADIDALIARKERLLELLAEKRQALITQAVTKGLDAGVEMKKSGVEWIGEVPSQWSAVRIGYVTRVKNGSTPDRGSSAYWENGTVPWLSSGKVNDYVVTEADEFITERALRDCPLEVLPPMSVLVGMVGQGKTRGMSAISMIPACINQNLAALVVTAKIHPRFLLHVLTAAYQPFREYGRGGQQDALNCEIIRAFRIPLPPLSEQKRILQFIEEQSTLSASLCALLARAVARLREYRQALITAAVTGQLDVTGEREKAA